MDVVIVRSSVYSLRSRQRVGAIFYDGAADLELWPGRGPDSDLREAWGPGLQESLQKERAHAGGEPVPMGQGLRLPPGRLHCDFLLWLVTRPPQPGTDPEPAPTLELLARAAMWGLEFVAERNVTDVAMPALGCWPGEVDRAERIAILVRTAHEYEERCFAAGRPPVVERVAICEPEGATVRAAHRLVARLAKAEDPAPPSAAKPTRAASSSTGRKRRSTKKPVLDPAEVSRALQVGRPYDRTHVYGEGDWFVHAKFGAGRVQQVTPEGAIVVLFEDGVERKMLHGR